MSDDKKKSKPASKDHRGGNVWMVLLAVTAAILLSAYLFSDSSRKIEYRTLVSLLKQHGQLQRSTAKLDLTEPGASQKPGAGETAASPASDSASVRQSGSATKASDRRQTPEELIAAMTATDPQPKADAVSDPPSVDAADYPRVVRPHRTEKGVLVEYSSLQNVLLGPEQITGSLMYRSLGKGGQNRTARRSRVDFVTYPVQGAESTADDLVAMLDAAAVPWDNDNPNNLIRDNLATFILVGAFILIGLLMLRRLGGAGSPMSFARSKGKLYDEDDMPIMFTDVAGIDEAVDEVSEVVDFLKNSQKYQALGGRIPKGVLLVGPPGTGKTLLAKAIAGEAGVPFFSLSGSDFVEMFVGVGAARVRDLFSQATSRAPCIIFIDELDALGKSRSGNAVGGHDEREQTLNALLVEMDGFGSNSGVIVVAATNRPETLDPALLRPGRFDRHVLVDRPDVSGRQKILSVHVKTVKLDDDVDLQEIASITSGFVGADLANLVNEAALLAARADKTSVGIQEFNEAVERVTAGLEKKSRVMNDDEKIRVAYHESGHAIVAAALPNTDPVHKVSIIPRGLAALGYMMQRPESERYLMTKSELESQMKVMLAGTLAEEMTFQDISTGAQNDLERCTEVARGMVMDYGMSRLGRVNLRQSTRSPFLAGGQDSYQMMHSEEMAKMIDKEVSRIVEDMLVQTREILEQRRDVLEAVTQKLLEVEVIDKDELLRLMDDNSNGPWLVPGTVTERPKARVLENVAAADEEAQANTKA